MQGNCCLIRMIRLEKLQLPVVFRIRYILAIIFKRDTTCHRQSTGRTGERCSGIFYRSQIELIIPMIGEVHFMAQIKFNIRMDEALKNQFENICKELGMDASTAFNIF